MSQVEDQGHLAQSTPKTKGKGRKEEKEEEWEEGRTGQRRRQKGWEEHGML